MTLAVLHDDALSSTSTGFALRLALPWIRSLPLSSLTGLSIEVDGGPSGRLRVDCDGRPVDADAVVDEPGWWFLQDRITVRSGRPLSPGVHDVVVSFDLVVPYLQIRPEGPLTLPVRIEKPLILDAATPARSPARAASSVRPPSTESSLASDDVPADWMLTASAFNWTPEIIRADRDATDIAVGIVADGIASTIEVEPGQLWRSFPRPAETEVDDLRDALGVLGGRVGIVGASLDDWTGRGRRRDDAERLAFLVPQLRDARRLGALGVRLPVGQAGEPLLCDLLPMLHDLDLVLFEEIQGQQTPGSAGAGTAIDTVLRIDDPQIRLLVDISMLMPAVPESYLEQLLAAGVPDALISRVRTEWRDPATAHAILDHLRAGGVPPRIHTLYMDMLVRFGRSDAAVLTDILPFVGAFHLKFWDLDDTDGRVSQPIRDLGALLGETAFSGTLTSEWGGHEWLDDDPAAMTRGHLALARAALAARPRTPRKDRP